MKNDDGVPFLYEIDLDFKAGEEMLCDTLLPVNKPKTFTCHRSYLCKCMGKKDKTKKIFSFFFKDQEFRAPVFKWKAGGGDSCTCGKIPVEKVAETDDGQIVYQVVKLRTLTKNAKRKRPETAKLVTFTAGDEMLFEEALPTDTPYLCACARETSTFSFMSGNQQYTASIIENPLDCTTCEKPGPLNFIGKSGDGRFIYQLVEKHQEKEQDISSKSIEELLMM